MKKNILTSLALFLVATMLFVSCKKEDEAAVMPIVKTLNITGITDSTAIGHGYVVQGANSITEEGICFSNTEELPTINSEKAISTDETAEIVGEMKNLAYKTRYYYRAYAIHSSGVEYGDTMSFISSIRLATVSVEDATSITGYSASCNGEVTDLGGGTVSAKGICWTRDSLPTIENDSTLKGAGLGAFSSNLTNLIGGSTYNVRAYAINEAGVAYSEPVSFSTLNYTPVVSTDSIKDVGETTATAYGNALYTGGTAITERGFCWGTSENPTIANDFVASGNGTGEFEANLTGLATGTTYFVRAYATNSVGTTYGDNISITTGGAAAKIYMVGGATGGWNWDSEVEMRSTSPEVYQTIAYFLNGEAFRFFAQPDWGPTSYNYPWFAGGSVDSDLEDALDGDNNFRVVGATGYYDITCDLANKTVTMSPVAEPEMYMTGGALGGWDWTTNYVQLTWVSNGTFEATTEFINGEAFRFFAQADWNPTSYNYPYFADGEVDALFEDALDGDNNFRFIGTTGSYKIKLNMLDKIVTMSAAK